MSKRVKAKAVEVPVPKDSGEANVFVGELGEAMRQRQLIQTALEETVAAAKAKAEQEAAPLNARIAGLSKGLQVWAEAHRDELLRPGRKSVELPAGEIGWRLRPPSVRISGVAAVIGTLKALGLTRFLRVKEEIDKKALLKEPDVAGSVPGVTVGSEGEEFFVAPIGVELSDGRAAA